MKRATVSLDELELPGRLMNVFVKDHCCTDSIEKLYYSCGFEPICVHCASEEVTDCTASQFLPQCQECISQGLDRVNRPKKNRNLCVLLCFVYTCLCAFVSDISIIIFLKIINNNLPPSWLSAIIGDGKQVFFKSWP